ncbi:MAG: hypothetical protein WA667_17855 [Candidatus Nitrosopolaris sp.]
MPKCEKGDLFAHKGFEWLDSQNLSIIDRQVIINSYLNEISTINELMTNVEMQMASLAISDKRIDLLLGFTGIDYYCALLLLYEIGDITRFSNPFSIYDYDVPRFARKPECEFHNIDSSGEPNR